LRWLPEDLAAYEAHGDANVTAIADRIAGVAAASPLHGTEHDDGAQHLVPDVRTLRCPVS
jgi:hypothetical protein